MTQEINKNFAAAEVGEGCGATNGSVEVTGETGVASDTFDNREVMVDVNHVTMTFNMASEQLNNLKEYFIKLAKHELFFKEFIALDDVSFKVRRGDVYGIVGTNGSGKSTVLKIIAGVLEPTRGTCNVRGTIAPLIELGAGFDYELTARENIYLNGALLGYSRPYIDEHFDEIVDFAELEGFLDLPMKNYSSGMTARIAFAIATIIVPDVLIVDEALAVGDVFFQEKCERRIKSLINDYGTTVLFVSHSMDQVERICQHAIWIEKGHKVMEGDVSTVCRAYRNMEYLDFVRDNNIMGDESSTADPGVLATRADLEGALAAVTAGAWVCQDAPASNGEGVTSEGVARQWACVELYRFVQSRRPFDFEPDERVLAAFSDAGSVDPAARTAVCWAVERKLLGGVQLESGHLALEPGEPIAFIDLAKMITRVFKNVLAYPYDVSPTSAFATSGLFDRTIMSKIMQGHQSGLFAPTENTCKAQACVVLHRLVGERAAGAVVPFEDVSESDYFYEAAQWAYEAKLIELGTGAIRFEPQAEVSVDALCAVCAKMLAAEGVSASADDIKQTVSQPGSGTEPATRAALAEVAAYAYAALGLTPEKELI
jgi:ABC-2 type transport system ATP-binding protein